MTILLPNTPSPIQFLFHRTGLTIGCRSGDIAQAFLRIPLMANRHLPLSMRKVLAVLCVRELTGSPSHSIGKLDIEKLEQRALGLFAGKPTSMTECRSSAYQRFNNISTDGILSHYHLELFIRERLPRFTPNRTICAQFSSQLILQVISPSEQAINSIQWNEWLSCAERLYRRCSTTS